MKRVRRWGVTYLASFVRSMATKQRHAHNPRQAALTRFTRSARLTASATRCIFPGTASYAHPTCCRRGVLSFRGGKRSEQSKQADYVDADDDSDDFTNLNETTNYYFYNTEVNTDKCGERDKATRDEIEGHSSPLNNKINDEGDDSTICINGEKRSGILIELLDDVPDEEPDGQTLRDEADGIHCLEYWANQNACTSLDYLLQYATRKNHLRRVLRMHAIWTTGILAVTDYLRHSKPLGTALKEIKSMMT